MFDALRERLSFPFSGLVSAMDTMRFLCSHSLSDHKLCGGEGVHVAFCGLSGSFVAVLLLNCVFFLPLWRVHEEKDAILFFYFEPKLSYKSRFSPLTSFPVQDMAEESRGCKAFQQQQQQQFGFLQLQAKGKDRLQRTGGSAERQSIGENGCGL
ncbi:hypothetical protein C4D60_Mb10t09190 [Musa balbisiana]|uniref:Transmembrane protein n=1 Tax=Musa balbisiana TaxID=52838 RepID=A0A4S8IVR8_MUSBA|nr:hypothetical protein C4D60_Mb10t09190 [Musa balbisiana]